MYFTYILEAEIIVVLELPREGREKSKEPEGSSQVSSMEIRVRAKMLGVFPCHLLSTLIKIQM